MTTFSNTRDCLLVLLEGVLDLHIAIAGDGDHDVHVAPVLVWFTHRGALLLVGASRLGVGDRIGAGKFASLAVCHLHRLLVFCLLMRCH